MTHEEIKTTINNMNTTDKLKKEIQKQCGNKNPNTLFCVYALSKKQTNSRCNG